MKGQGIDGRGAKSRRFRINNNTTVALCARCGNDLPQGDNHELCTKCIRRAAPGGPANLSQPSNDRYPPAPSTDAQNGAERDSVVTKPPMSGIGPKPQSGKTRRGRKPMTSSVMRKLVTLAESLQNNTTARGNTYDGLGAGATRGQEQPAAATMPTPPPAQSKALEIQHEATAALELSADERMETERQAVLQGHARRIQNADAWRDEQLSMIKLRHKYAIAAQEVMMTPSGETEKGKKRARDSGDTEAEVRALKQRFGVQD